MNAISQMLIVFGLMLCSVSASATIIVYSAAGDTPADIGTVVDDFRAALGTLNPNVVGSFGDGRREINWDGVPDAFSAPNTIPADFFNVNSPRGIIFATPGTGFQVSADSVNPTATPIEFGNIDASYPGLFEPFSPERLFTSLGSTILDVFFYIPGTTTPAFTSGFGAVFTDVDLAGTTLQLFDAENESLGTFAVPSILGDETLSFLGVLFTDELVSRVRITLGTQVLGPGILDPDLVVLDDFIFGEPRLAQAQVSEPATLALLGIALAALAFRRRKCVNPVRGLRY